MKNLKIVTLTLALTICTITFFAYTDPEYQKNAFLMTCYYFNPVGSSIYAKDVIGANRNLNESTFKYYWNWSKTNLTPPTFYTGGDCEDGEYLCALCYDESKYSLSQALNIAWSYYVSAGSLPHDGYVDPGISKIKTYRQETISNH